MSANKTLYSELKKANGPGYTKLYSMIDAAEAEFTALEKVAETARMSIEARGDEKMCDSDLKLMDALAELEATK